MRAFSSTVFRLQLHLQRSLGLTKTKVSFLKNGLKLPRVGSCFDLYNLSYQHCPQVEY